MKNEILKHAKWEKFFLQDLFDISMGNKLDMNKMSFDEPSVNFVGRSAEENGIAGKVDVIDNLKPYPSGDITIALGGSIGSTFLQPEPFYTSQNVAVLHLKEDQPYLVKLFLTTVIMFECRVKFVAFGRELNKHIKRDYEIYLPSTKEHKPDWAMIKEFMGGLQCKPLTTSKDYSQVSLNTDKWGEFRVGDLFHTFSRGKCHSQDDDLDDGNDLFYVGAKRSYNGIMRSVESNHDLTFKGNCVVFICNGEGSVGYAFYQDREFIPSGDLLIGYGERINPYTGLFLATVLSKERPRYSFGRKWGKYVKDSLIRLPQTGTGSPDWEWMENYIKNLPLAEHIV